MVSASTRSSSPRSEEKSARGELRRRIKAIIKRNLTSVLGAQGLRMLNYLQSFANYETCRVRVSARGAAKLLKIEVTSARRGLLELERMRVIECIKRGVGGSRSEYEIRDLPLPGSPTHHKLQEAVSGTKFKRIQNRLEKAKARTTGVIARAPVSPVSDTTGVQSAHHRCQPVTPPVSVSDTTGTPLQSLSIDISNISIDMSNVANDPVGSLQKEIVVETTLPAEREQQAQTKASNSTLASGKGMTRLSIGLGNASDPDANLRALSKGLSLAAREKQEELDELIDRHQRKQATKEIQELTNEAQNRMQALEALRIEKDRWEIQILG